MIGIVKLDADELAHGTRHCPSWREPCTSGKIFGSRLAEFLQTLWY
jgi:hypothetical protein